MSHDNQELLDLAARYLPGGSSWMWSLPRDLSFVVARAEGSKIVDTGGRTFIDYALGSGPLLLGHAHPAVVEAVREQAGNRSLVLFDRGDEVTVQAGENGIRFLLVSGTPIEEPVAWYGPIVMNTPDELRRAYAELQDGTFIKQR